MAETDLAEMLKCKIILKKLANFIICCNFYSQCFQTNTSDGTYLDTSQQQRVYTHSITISMHYSNGNFFNGYFKKNNK